MEYIELTKDYIYEITWHVEFKLPPRSKYPKDTRYFCYTGYSLTCKAEEELTQTHLCWYTFPFDICYFPKGRYADGKEYISIPNPIYYSEDTNVVFDKVTPYAPKQIIDALTN